MNRISGHRISCVQAGSIASELDLQPDDRLLMIDGQPLLDIFDYRMRQLSDHLLLSVQVTDGEIVEFDIEKDEDEDLGLEFDNPLLADCKACENHCVFCFIDQLPSGLRSSLYFKDDDLRLSFLTGNYVSLTNIDDQELDRLIGYHLSPMNISVHATDPTLRMKMMRHKQAGSVLERLHRIVAGGIAVNAQIVLCPGQNDGEQLERTIRDLIDLGPAVQSIAVVPVGLTRYRQPNKLFTLRPLNSDDAIAALTTIHAWQDRMLQTREMRLVYAADELYLKAGWALPAAIEYEDFPQLENGVGMASLFLQELADGVKDQVKLAIEPLWSVQPQNKMSNTTSVKPTGVILATGMAAEPFLAAHLSELSDYADLPVQSVAVINRFFGEQITVAGLLTGQDLADQLPEKIRAFSAAGGQVHLVLPDCMLKADSDLFLDDWTLQQLADQLSVPVHVCTADAPGLLGLLTWLATPKGVTENE